MPLCRGGYGKSVIGGTFKETAESLSAQQPKCCHSEVNHICSFNCDKIKYVSQFQKAQF